MKIKRLMLVLILSIFIPFGCSTLVPENPTKPESEFYADKKECEASAREYSLSRAGSMTSPRDGEAYRQYTEEMEYSRRCLRNKGWTYRKVSK